ncbi:MAG: hypothetical protein H7246_21650 [Phycisphaerae bacterium]|nr:hypothetical protein [Saprospiraceae bacterium]
MQQIKSTIFLAALLTIMSFSGIPVSNERIVKTTIYGTCSCQNASETTPKVELTLNPNHTFHYLNASNPAQKVDLKGNWAMSGKKVVLQADTAEKNFHKNWKFDKNQPCIVSRKGLNFTRLCDIESCK